MAIDRFSKEEFEAALPKSKNNGDRPLWECLGLLDGEYTYAIRITERDFREPVRLVIRSSIDYTEKAADTGQDSIRVFLEGGKPHIINDEDNNLVVRAIEWFALGKSGQRWVTRQPGWEVRLTDLLREMYVAGRNIKQCPQCGQWKRVWKTKTNSVNKGRLAAGCPNCKQDNGRWGHFQFLTKPLPSMQKKYGQKELPGMVRSNE